MKPLSKKFLTEFVKLVNGDFKSYESKNRFASGAKRILREVALRMDLPKSEYEVRFNPGGPAVSGDPILHGEHIYCNMAWTPAGFYYRQCNGRKDYHGGWNRFMCWSELMDLAVVADKFLEASMGRTSDRDLVRA